MADELEILYEDNQIIVVMKPQNLACCPDESGDDNLLDMIKRYVKETYNKPGNAYIGLVHRLDRPTGGVMVFAKTSKAAARLSAQMPSGEFEKRYLAVLCGAPKRPVGKIESYLKKNSINNMVYVCTQAEEGAKYAALEYSILQEDKGLALAEIRLLTGRTHQIRVQTASINCPVYGDMRYGGEKAVKGNLALWAYSLRFSHPVTHEKLRFICMPPEEKMPWSLFDCETVVPENK